MKKWIGIASCAALLLSGVRATEAATQTTAKTTAKYTMTSKAIYFNNKLVSSPKSFAVGNTAYMPIWYVMHALEAVNTHSAWDGKVWKLTAPSNVKVDLANVQVGSGGISIYLNGTLVKKVNGIVQPDPATGQPTTYVPIWYVMTLLDRVNIHSAWDGKTWTMTQPTAGSGDGGTPTPPVPPTPPTPPPVQDDTPQAAALPGTVSKEQMVSDFVSALHVPVTVPDTSPYDDVTTADANLGQVSTSVANQWVKPFASTHFGAGDVVTLADAEQFYWNYLNINNAMYQPGANLADWSRITGLSAGTAGGQYLTTADEQRLLANIAAFAQGYVSTGNNTYRLLYTPEDEYAGTFASCKNGNGSPYFQSQYDIQTAIVNTYNFFNGVNVQVQGSSLVTSVPVNSDRQWFAYATTGTDISYSVDNGSTWTSAPYFDATELSSSPSTVLLKTPVDVGLSLSYNNMVPATRGSVLLGGVNINYQTAGSSLQVERWNLQ